MQDDVLSHFDTVSLEDFERLTRIVTLESQGSAQFFADGKARFAQFFGKADQFFKAMTFQVLGVGRLNSADLMKAINAYGFMAASEKPAIVPQGFTGLWLPYADALNDGFRKSLQLTGMILDFNTMVGQLINDPELLKSVSGIPAGDVQIIGLHNLMKDVTAKFFNVNDEAIERPLGAVIERVADVGPLYTAINSYLLVDKNNPSTTVTKLITRSLDLSKSLVRAMDEQQVSKAVREQLIALTFSIAREVEAYSILLYRAKQFTLAVQDTPKHLTK